MFHEDDVRAVVADDVGGVDERSGETGTEEGEEEEDDVGGVGDCGAGFGVDVEAEGDLVGRLVVCGGMLGCEDGDGDDV